VCSEAACTVYSRTEITVGCSRSYHPIGSLFVFLDMGFLPNAHGPYTHHPSQSRNSVSLLYWSKCFKAQILPNGKHCLHNKYLPHALQETNETGTQGVWFSGQSSWLHTGDVLCFLLGTNWIYIYYVEESRPPLWSNGQSAWPQNGDVRNQTSWEVVGLERGSLSLAITIEEPLERKSSDTSLENLDYGRKG
jgi:hypothetical protein